MGTSRTNFYLPKQEGNLTTDYPNGVTSGHDSDIPEALADSIEHLQRLTRKRDVLAASAQETFDQIEAAVARTPLSGPQKLAIYLAVRDSGVKAPATRIAKAMGSYLNELIAWSRDGFADHFPVGLAKSGAWPADWRDLPRKGTPCTYLLMNESDRCVYVGCSKSVRARLKAHHDEGKKVGVVRWEIIICADYASARQLEADLIYQHQPYFNVSGRKNRAWVRPESTRVG